MDNTTASSSAALQSNVVFIDSNEIGSLLHVTEGTVIRWTNRRENPIPSLKLGWRTRRYDRAAVLAWIAAQGGKKS